MSNYVYKFINYDNDVIYVGKTTDIKQRLKKHFGTSGHLPKNCYDQVYKIFYADVSSKYNAELLETYYIKTYHPKFNKDKNYKSEEEDVVIEIPEPEWKEYVFIRSKTLFGGTSIEKTRYFPPYINPSFAGFESIDKAIDFNRLKVDCYFYEFEHFCPNILKAIPTFKHDMISLLNFIKFNTNRIESNVDIYINSTPEEQMEFNYIAFNIYDLDTFKRNETFAFLILIGFIEKVNDTIYKIGIFTPKYLREKEENLLLIKKKIEAAN